MAAKYFCRLVKFQSLVQLQTETEISREECLTLVAADSLVVVQCQAVVQEEVAAAAECLTLVAAVCLSNGANYG